MKKVFIASTMFSRNNGPANFAMNLYDYYKNDKSFFFFTPDINFSKNNIRKTKLFFSKIIKPFSMLAMGIDFFISLKKVKVDIVIWNFSVLSWFWITFGDKKNTNIVFVNDSLSLDLKNEFSYNFFRLFIFRILEKYCCRRSNKVITNSIIIKNKIIQKYNVDERNVKVLYKGINFDQIINVKKNFKIDIKNRIQIAFVKSNYKIGGLEKLCVALNKITDKEFQINIFGPSSVHKNLYDFNNVNLNLYPRLSKSDLFDRIINSDIFCVPCSKEAYGQANIEAIALQIPTIILPTDYQLILHDESYCFMPKNDDSISLSQTFLEIFNLSESQLEIKTKLGRKQMKKKYSMQNCFKNFDKLINEFTAV